MWKGLGLTSFEKVFDFHRKSHGTAMKRGMHRRWKSVKNMLDRGWQAGNGGRADDSICCHDLCANPEDQGHNKQVIN